MGLTRIAINRPLAMLMFIVGLVIYFNVVEPLYRAARKIINARRSDADNSGWNK